MAILAIDAGTTGVTALIVSDNAAVVDHDTQEFTQHFPANGWVEHDPDEIWEATLRTVRRVTERNDEPLSCVGITNQRETVVVWDRRTCQAARRAIVWQDRRTTSLCERIRGDGHEPRITELTGLRLDPYFSASKISWLRDNDPEVWRGITDGELVVGTIDSYLIARMTNSGVHVTDASNASRTLLFDLNRGVWSDELLALFGVPKRCLPEIVSSYSPVGSTDPAVFGGHALPISGIAGDQQAALFGQAAFDLGSAKCTYGTGSFILTNTGANPVPASHGLVSTVAWRSPDGTDTFAVEGSVFVTGAAVQWLRDGLRLIDQASDIEALAASVPDSGGVVFVPALTGLGAPHWDPHARGLVAGITRATTSAHLARATLEGIAFSVRDVVEAMDQATGDMPSTNSSSISRTPLAVDGGAAANSLLCQLQATILGKSVDRSTVLETTGLGAAMLAGLGAGVWSNIDELRSVRSVDHRFEPGEPDEQHYLRWQQAVEAARSLG